MKKEKCTIYEYLFNGYNADKKIYKRYEHNDVEYDNNIYSIVNCTAC